jgi:pyruvyltransferase
MQSDIWRSLRRKAHSLFVRIRAFNLRATLDAACRRGLILSWAHSPVRNSNLGDAISPDLFRRLTGHRVIDKKSVFNFASRPEYYFVGSILDNLSSKNAVIAGSGFISERGRVLQKPGMVLAVRGPLTRDLLLKQGVDCPEVYCDPALLIPEQYPELNVVTEKRWDVGIIPHYIDKTRFLRTGVRPGKNTYCTIDVEGPFRSTISAIQQCSTIVSSSLHGIVIAHAFGIPAAWIILSDMIIGGRFKFEDYYLSVGMQSEPAQIERDLHLQDVLPLCAVPSVQSNIAAFERVFTEHMLAKRFGHF